MQKLPAVHPSSPDYGERTPRLGQDAGPEQHGRDRAERAWKQAVRQFAADWQRHLDRWPHPEENSARRKLAPAVERELALGCEKVHAAEREITSRLHVIEAEQPNRALIGLKHRLKDQEGTKDKAAQYLREMPDFTPGQALAMVPDPIRYTFVYRAEGYAAGVVSDVKSLVAAGFEMLRLKNYWDSAEYKGINSQWRDERTGQRFEVQFHTSVSFEAKQLTHSAYERLRSGGLTDAEEFELEVLQSQLSAAVPVPQGSHDVGDRGQEP